MYERLTLANLVFVDFSYVKCVFVSRPIEIATIPLKNGDLRIVKDFDEQSNNNNGKPWKSSRTLRVKPIFFIFLHVSSFSSYFFIFQFLFFLQNFHVCFVFSFFSLFVSLMIFSCFPFIFSISSFFSLFHFFCFFFFYFCFPFSGAQNLFFWPQLLHDFLYLFS